MRALCTLLLLSCACLLPEPQGDASVGAGWLSGLEGGVLLYSSPPLVQAPDAGGSLTASRNILGISPAPSGSLVVFQGRGRQRFSVRALELDGGRWRGGHDAWETGLTSAPRLQLAQEQHVIATELLDGGWRCGP